MLNKVNLVLTLSLICSLSIAIDKLEISDSSALDITNTMHDKPRLEYLEEQAREGKLSPGEKDNLSDIYFEQEMVNQIIRKKDCLDACCIWLYRKLGIPEEEIDEKYFSSIAKPTANRRVRKLIEEGTAKERQQILQRSRSKASSSSAQKLQTRSGTKNKPKSK